jgi:hypothetical protein
MAADHPAIEVFSEILGLVYIPALLVLCLVSLYYLAPLLTIQSGAGLNLWQRLRLVISFLLLLLLIGLAIFQISS